MSMNERPKVLETADGGKCFEHEFKSFYLKAYVPANDLDGQVNNYTFKAPLLLIFEETKQDMKSAIAWAMEKGLDKVAAAYDAAVYFIYPTCDGGWKNASESLYADVISEVKMVPEYKDCIVEVNDFFTKTFKGYWLKGAIFRADIYSFGVSADFVATKLLKKLDGEYLWGPGEITPAMCSMENLSVVPNVLRKDIAILSVGNSEEINKAFDGCEYLLVKDKADYAGDFHSFVRKYKRWCGIMQIEPDYDELNMTAEPGYTTVKTSPDNKMMKGTTEHKVGYFAYYNNGIFDKGPAPLLIGFHGGGDSSMFFTYVSGWWEVCHRHDFLYVAIENHQLVTATEVMEILKDLKTKYSIDEKRIYAAGFSMGSGKTWDMFHEYPEVFAGVAPGSALFPMRDNHFGMSITDEGINKTIPVPMFYSGGEQSHLPELPRQDGSCGERIEYLARVNGFAGKLTIDYADKSTWKDSEYGIEPDRVEKIKDESRGSILTVRYYNSDDGVCRTALASIDNQQHEYRQHTAETAWNFISQFTR